MIPERTAKITDKQLEWAARKAAGDALKPSDTLLDIEVGNVKRFRDNGIDKPVVTPKRWARAIPAVRGIMNVAYTLEQVLFLPDGLAVNCAIIRVHRAQILDDQHQLFAFAGRSGELVLLELEPASRGSVQRGRFQDRLIAFRDQERAKLPAEARQRLEQIDAVVQGQTIEDLWARPPAPIGMEPGDVDRLAGLGAASQPDGIDEAAWNRLRLLALKKPQPTCRRGGARTSAHAVGSGLNQHRKRAVQSLHRAPRARQIPMPAEPCWLGGYSGR